MEEREGGDFTLKYVDLRAILGLFSLHPAGCSKRILVRHIGRERKKKRTRERERERDCISYDTKTSHYFPLSLPLSLDRSAQSLPPSSYSSPPRGARGHVTTIMPVLLLPSISPSSTSAISFLPSSCFTSHPAVRISPVSNYVYPLNESRRKRCLPTIN